MKLIAYATGIQHIGIQTSEYETTLNFYNDLWLKVELETVNPVSGGKVAFLKCESMVLEIYQVTNSSMCYGAVDHIALSVIDIEAVYKIAQNCGAKILEEKIQHLPFWKMVCASSR